MSYPAEIDEITQASKDAALQEFGCQLRDINKQQVEAVTLAVPALARLVKVCGHKTGQGGQVRALLYSAWNGQGVSLCQNLLGLDWPIKRDLCAVFLAFGCEPRGAAPFFYDTIRAAFTEAGLWDWFLEAFKEEGD